MKIEAFYHSLFLQMGTPFQGVFVIGITLFFIFPPKDWSPRPEKLACANLYQTLPYPPPACLVIWLIAKFHSKQTGYGCAPFKSVHVDI